MKKILPLALMLSLAFVTGGYSQDRADVVESITPSSAIMFLKTARIKNLIGTVRFVTENLLHREYAEKFNKKVSDIKSKTGIDPLDLESLKQAGIDVERSMSMAMYAQGKKNEDRMLLFVPVMDEKIFPLKFVEILKKMAGAEKADVFPAITEYKNRTVYQMGKDIFTTALDGVFVIGSTGELLRSVIDSKENSAGYLAIDPMYMDYMSRLKKNYDVRVYVTRDFLKDALKSRPRPEGEQKGGGKKVTGPGYPGAAGLMEVLYVADASGEKPSMQSEIDRLATGPSPFNAVDYASLGGSVNPSAVDIEIAVRFNNTSGTVNTFLDVIRTGVYDRALQVKNANTYAYVSFDFNKIEELCRNSVAGCGFYGQIKDEIRGDLGIDFEKDVLPYYSGVLNIIAGQPKGGGGGYLFFLPMNDQEQVKKVWEKSSSYLKEKFKGTERYGTDTIGGARSFWHIDSKNNRIHMVYDRRGLYMGNDRELLGMALAGKELKQPVPGDAVLSRLGGNVFFLAHIKKESFFGALLMLYAYRNKEISGIVDMMTDLNVIGEKNGAFISFDVMIRLMKRK
jgi:hypothetical protein